MEAIWALKGKIPLFEVNTGAISRGYRTSPYPQMEFLRELHICGFCAVITSDCHDAEKLDCGFELAAEEKTGVVASPENREKSGGIWYPGDVCQTAIGQSDTLVTPLQLANYIATVANGGTRYKPHIIRSVENLNKNQETETEIEVLEEIKLKEENYTAVREGIRKVVTEGTAFNAFHGCEVSVAAKTGSAQTGRYTNGICVAYAPYDKPRIAIACVIEKAGSGSRTAGAIRKIVDSYFDSEKEHTENPVNTLLR